MNLLELSTGLRDISQFSDLQLDKSERRLLALSQLRIYVRILHLLIPHKNAHLPKCLNGFKRL